MCSHMFELGMRIYFGLLYFLVLNPVSGIRNKIRIHFPLTRSLSVVFR